MRPRSLLAFLALAACSTTEKAPGIDCPDRAFAGSPLGVRCDQLVDTEGRAVLLHGVNARINGLFDGLLEDGTSAVGPTADFGDADAQAMRAMGLNALRLPLSWSAIEPTETGGFAEDYLDRAAAVVAACRKAGVLVLLDMHQDGYSKFIGDDGAPKWATLPAPPPRDPNDGNRNVGPAAQAAFNTFFGTGADGVRLRQRFAAMLVHVAGRLATDPAVFGFELYNEPLSTDERLVAFDKEMVAALRAVMPAKLILFEPSAIRNVIDSALPGNEWLGGGSVYAPHVYTCVFSPCKTAATKETLRRSNASARDEADGYRAPLVITEWGYGPSSSDFGDYVRWQQELEDEYAASAFLWVWKEPGLGQWGFFDFDPKTLAATRRDAAVAKFSRVRVEAVAGQLLSVSYDADARALEVRFRGDDAIRAPNLISIGATPSFTTYDATCDGAGVAAAAGEPLALPCSGAGEHVLRLRAR